MTQFIELAAEWLVLRSQLDFCTEEKKRQMAKIDQLADQLATATRLLEHKVPEPPKIRRWWQF